MKNWVWIVVAIAGAAFVAWQLNLFGVRDSVAQSLGQGNPKAPDGGGELSDRGVTVQRFA